MRTHPAKNMGERIDAITQGTDGFLDLINYLKWHPWRSTIVGSTNETMADFAVKHAGFKHAEPSGLHGMITATRKDVLKKQRELRYLHGRIKKRKMHVK